MKDFQLSLPLRPGQSPEGQVEGADCWHALARVPEIPWTVRGQRKVLQGVGPQDVAEERTARMREKEDTGTDEDGKVDACVLVKRQILCKGDQKLSA